MTGLIKDAYINWHPEAAPPPPVCGCACCPVLWDFDASRFPDVPTLRSVASSALSDGDYTNAAIGLEGPSDLSAVDTVTKCCGAQTIDVHYFAGGGGSSGIRLFSWFGPYIDTASNTPTYSHISALLRMLMPASWSGSTLNLLDFSANDDAGDGVSLSIAGGLLSVFGFYSGSFDVGPDSLVATGECVDVVLDAAVSDAGDGWNVTVMVAPSGSPLVVAGSGFIPWTGAGGGDGGGPEFFGAGLLSLGDGPADIWLSRWQVVPQDACTETWDCTCTHGTPYPPAPPPEDCGGMLRFYYTADAPLTDVGSYYNIQDDPGYSGGPIASDGTNYALKTTGPSSFDLSVTLTPVGPSKFYGKWVTPPLRARPAGSSLPWCCGVEDRCGYMDQNMIPSEAIGIEYYPYIYRPSTGTVIKREPITGGGSPELQHAGLEQCSHDVTGTGDPPDVCMEPTTDVEILDGDVLVFEMGSTCVADGFLIPFHTPLANESKTVHFTSGYIDLPGNLFL